MAPIHHIKITNIPSVCGVQQLRKWISKIISIPPNQLQLRKAQKWNWAYLMIKGNGEEMMSLEDAKEKIHGSVMKGRTVAAMIEEKIILSTIDDFKGEDYDPTKCVMDQVTPLWKLSYQEQLVGKEEKLRKIISSISKQTNILPIIASPTIDGYRNKCEFTIAYDYHQKDLPTVGFLMGRFKDGHVSVGNASNCKHVPQKLKDLANTLELFIRRGENSHLLPMDRSTKEGFWRLLLGRLHNDQVMAVVQVNEIKDLSIFSCFGGWDSFLDNLKNALGSSCDSLSIQQTSAMNHGLDSMTPIILLKGEETLRQDLKTPTGKLTFSISPLSFFQVNQSATELLYSIVRDYAIEDVNATISKVLLDLCCGTGTIGMILSSSFKKVYGIDIASSSIDDARKASIENHLTNIEFEASPVEKKIDSLLKEEDGGSGIEFVVVLDPPRNGVHSSVIKAVRRCHLIKRVIFVACNAEASKANMIDLVRPSSNSLLGEPFTLIKAVPVDLFPHTHHCELVLQFKR